MSTVSDPFASILQGLLRGHETALQIRRQQLDEQEFRQRQALQQQQMSTQDIMNRQALQQNARPVSDYGTVDNPAGPEAPSPVPGMPSTPGAPAYSRKADASRTVQYGGRKYELKTPEEQQWSDLQRQMNTNDAVEQWKLRAAQQQRANVLAMEGGGIKAKGLGALQIPDGTVMTREEYTKALEGLQGMRQKALVKLGPGDVLADTGAAIEEPQEASGPTMEPIAQTPRAPIPGLPQNLQPRAAGLPSMAGGSPAQSATGRVPIIASVPPKLEEMDKYVHAFLADKFGVTDPSKASPGQRLQAITAYKHDPEILNNQRQWREEGRALQEQGRQDRLDNQQKQQAEQSYRFHAGELDKEAKPVVDRLQRLTFLKETLGQNTPQADALVAPELMTAVAGGLGSGVRITKGEIEAVTGGRSNWEALQAKINKWRTDPTQALSITPEQRREMNALVDVLSSKLSSKADIISEARSSLENSTNPLEHRKILNTARDKLVKVDTQQTGRMVNMRAPDGTVRPIPADQVAHYKQLGAVEVEVK